VIFISLLVRPAFFAAFGRFHFAENSISIDCRVSGRIPVILENFFVKIWWVLIHEKVIGSKICREFFPPKMELKVVFASEGISIRKCVFVKFITAEFQHGHKLFYGFAIHDTLLTFIRIKKELTGHGIHDTSGQVLVLHGVCLITCLL